MGSTSCTGDTVTFTCTISAIAHTWTFSFGILNSVTISRENPIVVEADYILRTVTNLGGPITTSLELTSSAELDGRSISCTDPSNMVTDIQIGSVMMFGE